MKQTIAIEIDVPDGYELTGEYRKAYHEEYYKIQGNTVAQGPSACEYPILRKIPPVPWAPLHCETTIVLCSDGGWATVYYAAGSTVDKERYKSGFLFPASTPQATKEEISEAVRSLLLSYHEKRDGVRRV